MFRVLSITILITSFFASIHLTNAASANESADDLSTVVVSAARTDQSSLSTASDVSIITAEDIEKSAASNITEVLRLHSGLVVSDRFGDGSSVSIGIRGFGETANANTLILLNGRRLNNTDIAPPDLNSISVNDIDRIEIVYGSAGVLYGDQAVGGVVNIISKSPYVRENRVQAVVGSYGQKEIKQRFAGPIGDNVGYKLILEDRARKNYRQHNEKEFQQLLAGLEYRHQTGSAFVEYQYVDDYQETPGALYQEDLDQDRRQVLPELDNNFSAMKSNIARLGLKHQLSDLWSLEAELTSRRSDGEFILGFAGYRVTEKGFQNRDVSEFTPRFIGAIPFNQKEMLITAGIDLQNSDYFLMSVLGEQENDQEARSLYFRAMVPTTEKATMTLGVRRGEVKNKLKDDYTFAEGKEINDSENVFEIGYTYEPNNMTKLFARVEDNYRFPKVDEYTNPDLEAGSPKVLKTQSGRSLELGLHGSILTRTYSVSLYQLSLENEIAYDPTAGAGFGANTNLDKTRRRGILLAGAEQIDKKRRIGFNAALVKSEINSGALVGKELPLVPKIQVNLYTDSKYRENLWVHWELAHTEKRVLSGDFQNTLNKLPAHTVLNAAAKYLDNSITYNIRINNVFNKKYSETGLAGYDQNYNRVETFYPSPERQLAADVSLTF